jgi:hypothetical protein
MESYYIMKMMLTTPCGIVVTPFWPHQTYVCRTLRQMVSELLAASHFLPPLMLAPLPLSNVLK